MMHVGQFAELERTYTPEDLQAFAALSSNGGHQPDTVPEPLIAALFSYLLGVELPGGGTNYLKQEMQFLDQAKVGEALRARVEITRLRPEKHLVDLWASCTRADGSVVCEGRSLVLAKDVGA